MVKATIKSTNGALITVEGSHDEISKILATYEGQKILSATQENVRPDAVGGSPRRRVGTPDAATFLREKKATTDKQRVAVLAYYLTHYKDTAAFKKADIEKMNTESRGGSFNLDDGFANASKPSTNYLSAIGKGQKQLTSFGDQIVEALPDENAVRQLEKSEKPGRRRKKSKTAKKS